MVQIKTDPNCLFCKIIAGQIQCSKIAEDDKTFAFLDINPVNPGHALVVPKDHHVNITDTPSDIMKCVIAMAKRIAEVVKNELPCDGVNVSMNNFPASGQVVMHTHMHIIPRFDGDGLKPWSHKSYQDGQAQEIAKRISSHLK